MAPLRRFAAGLDTSVHRLFGVLFTATFMRLTEIYYPGRRLPALPEWVHHYGVWLILLPMAWTVAATLTVRELDQLPQVRNEWMAVAYVLLIVLTIFLVDTTIGALTALIHATSSMQGG